MSLTAYLVFLEFGDTMQVAHDGRKRLEPRWLALFSTGQAAFPK